MKRIESFKKKGPVMKMYAHFKDVNILDAS